MHRKSTVFFYLLLGLFALCVLLFAYLLQTKSLTKENEAQKVRFVHLVGLPDLALVTETTSIRHRSLTDTFSLYRDDPSLREYFPSTFTYTVTEVATSVPVQEEVH